MGHLASFVVQAHEPHCQMAVARVFLVTTVLLPVTWVLISLGRDLHHQHPTIMRTLDMTAQLNGEAEESLRK